MKNRTKILFLLTALLISVVLISGCSSKNNTNKSNNVSSQSQQDITEEDSYSADSNTENQTSSMDAKKNTTESTNTNSENNTKELPIYSIDEDTLEKVDSTATIPADSEITPELIVNEVVKNFEDIDLIVGIDSVTTDKNTVIVSFKSNTAPLVNVGSGLEISILDAIGMSLIDNLEDYNKVIFRVEGKAYESGHMSFGIDEVYLENQN